MNYKPLTEINKVNNTCFLAGPCPRAGQKWKDWRVEMIHLLKKYGFNGDTIDPTNPNYDTTDPDYKVFQQNGRCDQRGSKTFKKENTVFFYEERL